MDSAHVPYPRRPDARDAIAENPAEFIETRNVKTRRALIQGMRSLQRLAWWERVIDEESLSVSNTIENELDAKRAELLGVDETEDEPTPEEVEAAEARKDEVREADTLARVMELQDAEVNRDDPRPEVVAEINARRDELEAQEEDDEDVQDDTEAESGQTCPFCGEVAPVSAYLADDECPACEAALTEICDAGSIDGDTESPEVTA